MIRQHTDRQQISASMAGDFSKVVHQESIRLLNRRTLVKLPWKGPQRSSSKARSTQGSWAGDLKSVVKPRVRPNSIEDIGYDDSVQPYGPEGELPVDISSESSRENGGKKKKRKLEKEKAIAKGITIRTM